MEEDKGARKTCTKSCMWCFIFVFKYFVSDCHSLSEKEDQELCKEERRYQYQVTTEDFKKCACADLSGDRGWVYVCVCGKLRALSHDQSDVKLRKCVTGCFTIIFIFMHAERNLGGRGQDSGEPHAWSSSSLALAPPSWPPALLAVTTTLVTIFC